MKMFSTAAFALVAAAFLLAQDASAACKGREVQRTGPRGTVTVCLDGSYKTCVRDARDRLGWGSAGVERCNQLRAQGRIR